MLSVRSLYPVLCVLSLIAAIMACSLPGTGSGTSVDATQTMETLATIVASTLQSTDVEIPGPTDEVKDQETQETPLPDETATPLPLIPTATETPALGKIVGLVWEDYNENGLIDPGEPAMPGAAVLLGEGACVTAGYMATATTDDGSFIFEDIPPGEYCVSVLLPHGCGGFAPTTDHPRTITVNPGLDLGGLMFGFLENPC
jgi:hypothetical protein